MFSPKHFKKRFKHPADLLPHSVHLHQIVPLPVGIDECPCFLPSAPAPDSTGEHVVFQQVDLILCQIPSVSRFSLRTFTEPAAQKPEHTLIREIRFHHLKHRTDELDKRMKQDRPRLIHEIRDSIRAKNLLHIIVVQAHIAGYHRNVPVAVMLLPHKFCDLSCRVFELLARIFQTGDFDLILLLFPLLIIRAEQILLHEI